MGQSGIGRKTMRATWLLGGTGMLFLGSAALASPFSIQLVIDDQTSLDFGQYQGSVLAVAGNGGAVATYSQVDGDIAILTHLGGTHTLIAGGDLGFQQFADLSVTPGNVVTFMAANNDGSNKAVYQATFGGAVRNRLDDHNATIDGTDLIFNHYQVNSSGVVVYKNMTSSQQAFTTALGTSQTGTQRFRTIAEEDGNNVQNFNLQTADVLYRRQAIPQNGSVVFYAEDPNNTPGIYRLPATGPLQSVSLPGVTVSNTTRVWGASDNSVLLSTTSGTRTYLSLSVNGTTTALTNYLTDIGNPRVTNAVMTQQNRVAYFAAGDTADHGSLHYFDPTNGDKLIATEGTGFTDSTGAAYHLKSLSIADAKNTNPMLNDHGMVVFDAIITADADPNTADLQSLIAWDLTTGQKTVVVKAAADGSGGNFSDDFGGGKILQITPDTLTDQGGDVLKDGLSEDNFLAFVMTYSDADSVEHDFAVGLVQLPEPATTSAFVIVGAALLRRRRRK
jgi:hypothetical protein